MIVLAADIGNTRTTFGLFIGKTLAATTHMRSADFSTERIWKQVRSLPRQSGILPAAISGVVFSSVVPRLTRICSIAIRRHLRKNPFVVGGESGGLLRIDYKNPRELGADRICNAVAAFHGYGGPVIVVDLGTAVTYDVVAGDGTFLGGAIAPGIQTAVFALHRRTAQLPDIEARFPRHVIGKSTIENLQSGILYGAVDAMEGMVRRIKAVTGKQTKVILTGGYSALIRRKSKIFDAVEPALVLKGARLIYESAGTKTR
ncbi:MAG TPA: type III pantothenate kinase [Bacteroidota bacterium]|nr:type III pantothenate kinase [Bacteroidota bacterium]